MGIRWQLFLSMTLGVLFMLGLGSWQVMKWSQQESLEQLRSSLFHEVHAARQMTEFQVEKLAADILDLINEQEVESKQRGEAFVSPRFLQSDLVTLALVGREEEGQWETLWSIKRPTFDIDRQKALLQTALMQISDSDLSKYQTVWKLLDDPAGSPVAAVMMSVELRREVIGSGEAMPQPVKNESRVVVGLIPSIHLSRWSEAYKGSSREFIVVDPDGYALSYNQQQYVGANLGVHPVVQDVLAKKEIKGSIESESLAQEEVQAAFERLESSNLYTIVSSKLDGPIHAIVPTIVSLLGFTLAGLALMVSLSFYFIDRKWGYVESHLPQAGQQKKDVEEESSTEDKKLIFAGALANLDFVGKPLYSDNKDVAVDKADQNLEQENAENKDEPLVVKSFLLDEAIDKTLKAFADKLAGVDIKVDIPKSLRISGDMGQLQTALQEVLQNALDAMVHKDNKSIVVSATQQADTAVLTIEDFGDGLAASLREKVFYPFFSTRQSEDRRGMGLTVVKSIMEKMSGNVELVCKDKHGLLVQLTLPVCLDQVATQVPQKQLAPINDIIEEDLEKEEFVVCDTAQELKILEELALMDIERQSLPIHQQEKSKEENIFSISDEESLPQQVGFIPVRKATVKLPQERSSS